MFGGVIGDIMWVQAKELHVADLGDEQPFVVVQRRMTCSKQSFMVICFAIV